jgi:hypothetical protein
VSTSRGRPASADALLHATALAPSADVPGEGSIYTSEPPPLPGEETQIFIEEIPADQVDAVLRREGLIEDKK